MITRTFAFQLSRIKSNLPVFTLLVILAIAIIWFGNYHDAGKGHASLTQACAYLFAMWFCSFCIDFYALMRPAKNDFPVRRPVTETIITFLCASLGVAVVMLRFFGPDWEHAGGLYKISVALVFMLFLYPIGLTIIMLAMGYKFRELGFRLQGFVPSIAVILVTAGAAFAVAPGRLTLHDVLQEGGGIAGALLMGFVYAGLSEEIFRLICQTRLGAAIRHNGFGWFVASVAWALMHSPKWYAENHNGFEAIFSALRIVPLGLMWGYLTYRTKSILPSVLAHGMNVWGLQNF